MYNIIPNYNLRPLLKQKNINYQSFLYRFRCQKLNENDVDFIHWLEKTSYAHFVRQGKKEYLQTFLYKDAYFAKLFNISGEMVSNLKKGISKDYTRKYKDILKNNLK